LVRETPLGRSLACSLGRFHHRYFRGWKL